MVAQITPAMALADAFGGLGLGVLLAVLYDVIRFFMPHGKVRMFVLDIFMFVAAAFFTYSYAVSFAYSAVIRWYIILGVGLGYGGYLICFMPITRFVQKWVYAILCLPFKLIWYFVLKPCGRAIKGRAQKLQAKRKAKIQNKRKSLHKDGKVLYNSN
ncbi:MAG: spore cortex biosynthesis protein YabQ [Oscillospiraceae bacterium]|nr:spore cortex biosynthesis protein YabQ [Oscillospiraceae bacterium]